MGGKPVTDDQFESLLFEVKDIGRSVRSISIIVQVCTAIVVVFTIVGVFFALRGCGLSG